MSQSSRGRKLSRIGPRSSRSRSISRSSSGDSRMSSVGFGGRTAPFPYGKKLQSPYFNPLPSILKSQLRYVENVTLYIPPGSDDAIQYYFSCNGLHDPNITGTGHQPYFYDQLSKLYNHYRVDRSVCTVKPVVVVPSMMFGCNITAQAALVPYADNVQCERKMHNYKVICTDQTVPPDTKVVTKWSAASSFPLTGREDMNARYGFMPVEQMYFETWVRRAPSITDPIFITLLVEIDFWVSSFEVVQLAGS